ncbi:MAG: cob(I)yrinic acid a,c-diamide adenosyltransferase [Saprospiraceae bacterium]
MKIYTKTGDKGQTALFGGRRVPKSHLRVDSYGTVDELNSFIGWLADLLENEHIRHVLKTVQDRLFTLGAHLASDPEKHPPTPDLLPEDIALLEREMDAMDELLPPLRNFILPGGHPAVSACHVCRTVCRRAERLVVALHETEPVEPQVLEYLNRLSDYFFVLSRKIGQDFGVAENVWNPRKKV